MQHAAWAATRLASHRGAAAGLAAAAVLAAHAAASTPAETRRAEGTDAVAASSAAPPSAEQLAALHAWLRSRGARVDDVRVAPCTSDPALGLGLFATSSTPARWLPRLLRPGYWLGVPGRTLADFPLDGALTAHSCTGDPLLGDMYAAWLRVRCCVALERAACTQHSHVTRPAQEETLSEREAVMLFLVVVRAGNIVPGLLSAPLADALHDAQERARGVGSAWAPYLAVLPSQPPTPLWWRAEELAELKGTTLADAVRAQTRACEAAWQRLEPLARTALRRAGVSGAQLSAADLRWVRQ